MLLSSEKRYFFIGSLNGILANVLLGFSTVFWKYIGSLSAVALVSYRIYLSLLIVVLVVCACRGLVPLLAQLSVRSVFLHSLAALLIAINWAAFIWASIHGRVLESSLGYLIAPIFSIVVGVVVYKEVVTRCKALALVIMVVSVFWLLVLSDDLEVSVYLSIGTSWGIYSCLKKMTSLNVFSGLLLESSVLALFCTFVLFYSGVSIAIPADFGLLRTLLLFCCGVVSVAPLALFSFSAKRLTITSMGLLQFVLPVTQFFVATVIYKQALSPVILLVLLAVLNALLLVVLEPVLIKFFVDKKWGRNGL
ncbi:hypothetical protein SOP85_30945 [Pseudomonas sp. YuFO20]|uniref:EamA family transporter n=1 Tax=Pseudomonas sp. YuFO20 TaxID=3095362 RepID=UPI002B24525B|nr:hypothetical protein [Pseudomonas sp. YuFO20]MEB2519796.1 hypothetical protein [Pseudomonas sp. YuFO20]